MYIISFLLFIRLLSGTICFASILMKYFFIYLQLKKVPFMQVFYVSL